MKNLEKLLIENKPIQCAKCKGKMFYMGRGKFYCRSCGYETLDDMAKVKAFLEKNGDSPIMYISQATGVEPEVIEIVLREGNIEIPKESKYFLKCAKCGCSIKDGTFCPTCVHEMTGGIKALINEDIRKNSLYRNTEMVGKMHTRSRRS